MHAAAAPITLADALDRIATLEQQLAFASDLLSRHADLSLAQELVKAGLEPLALPSPNGKPNLPNESSAVELSSYSRHNVPASEDGRPTTAATTTEGAKADPASDASPAVLDLGPLILRALEIRKRVHAGSMNDEEGVVEVDGMVEEHGLTDEQAATIRAWAGQA
ncbi:hypothetical protein JCM10908_003755 [Rhodotorula pacifica]|uniref:uncharacterized protein n=1 Tax=Rhodotorula pacifica TaxID=1495444 RepID=UPI00317EBB50